MIMLPSTHLDVTQTYCIHCNPLSSTNNLTGIAELLATVDVRGFSKNSNPAAERYYTRIIENLRPPLSVRALLGLRGLNVAVSRKLRW